MQRKKEQEQGYVNVQLQSGFSDEDKLSKMGDSFHLILVTIIWKIKTAESLGGPR